VTEAERAELVRLRAAVATLQAERDALRVELARRDGTITALLLAQRDAERRARCVPAPTAVIPGVVPAGPDDDEDQRPRTWH
jgi:hypothetical protein